MTSAPLIYRLKLHLYTGFKLKIQSKDWLQLIFDSFVKSVIIKIIQYSDCTFSISWIQIITCAFRKRRVTRLIFKERILCVRNCRLLQPYVYTMFILQKLCSRRIFTVDVHTNSIQKNPTIRLAKKKKIVCLQICLFVSTC